MAVPSRKDIELRNELLREVHAHGGTAISEDLRPAIIDTLNYDIALDETTRWRTTVSWALIDMRDDNLLDSPFGEPNSEDNRSWITRHRPGRDPTQQVWRLTSRGRQLLNTIGFSAKGVRTIISSSQDVSKDFSVRDIKDARERIAASIVQRRGQTEFRQSLLRAYSGQCAITCCDAEQALEAAHIIPYKGTETNHLTNGLLLRADIHTLFDLALLAVDTAEMTVAVSPELDTTTYGSLAGTKLNLPEDESHWPSREALDFHREQGGL